MNVRLLLLCLALPATGACTHASSDVREQPVVWNAAGRSDCNTAATRIQALMAQGKFAEAEVLIAEASAGGLISQPHAAAQVGEKAHP